MKNDGHAREATGKVGECVCVCVCGHAVCNLMWKCDYICQIYVYVSLYMYDGICKCGGIYECISKRACMCTVSGVSVNDIIITAKWFPSHVSKATSTGATEKKLILLFRLTKPYHPSHQQHPPSPRAQHSSLVLPYTLIVPRI